MHLVPLLAEFDSTLKVFTQLVDFGRTGTLRDFETWSVAALVEHLGDDCYVDEAGLVGPTGPPVDRWLSGEPLETAELARFRTNGSHTVALLRWAQGLLGPLACAFKVLGAIEGLHLKSILEGPDCRDPADVHPHIPERHLWKRTLSFDTVAARVLLQTIGKGAFPLEIVPSTIRGLRALRLRFKEFGGERWYPEGGLLNAKTEITCCVCLEVITWRDQVTLRPCDHSVCSKCSKQLDACPLCRTAITDLCSPSQFPAELNNYELFKICGLHPTIAHAGLEILELGERRSARAPGWPSLQGVRLVEVFIERTGGRVDRYLGDFAILEEKAQPLHLLQQHAASRRFSVGSSDPPWLSERRSRNEIPALLEMQVLLLLREAVPGEALERPQGRLWTTQRALLGVRHAVHFATPGTGEATWRL